MRIIFFPDPIADVAFAQRLDRGQDAFHIVQTGNGQFQAGHQHSPLGFHVSCKKLLQMWSNFEHVGIKALSNLISQRTDIDQRITYELYLLCIHSCYSSIPFADLSNHIKSWASKHSFMRKWICTNDNLYPSF